MQACLNTFQGDTHASRYFLRSWLRRGRGVLPLTARANANLKMMIPANPGGGWDTTGRALGKALQEAGVASSVSYDNKAAPPVRSAWRSSSTAPRATETR